ncbi:MAG: GNAT family N-acetyltransferase [Anaerolineae bacterium]|nr:GNAT family N-acetyltransferase [Anaerolineae bacterium]
MSKPKPILLDFPDAFETERLLIRSPLPGDGPALNEAVVESLDSLRPWMPWAQTAPTVEEEEEIVRKGRLRFLERSDLWLLLFLKGTNIVVGGSGLHRIDWDVPRFEIGYWCRSRFEGQGYITEAVRAITAFAFTTLGAQRVMIRMDTRNVRSRAVAERAGYVLEGEERHDARAVDGTLRNTLVFSMLPDEFKRLYG